MDEAIAEVSRIVSRIGQIQLASHETDIYDAGFSSIASLELLMELESTFGVSIQDDEFIGQRSVLGLAALVHRLREKAAP